MTTAPDVRAESLRWIERALDEEMPGSFPRANIRDHADALLQMAEEVVMPVEELVSWIRFRKPGKQWSQVELRLHIIEYCDLRKRLGLEPPPVAKMCLCPQCVSHAALWSDGEWLCPKCGVVHVSAA